MAIEDAIYSLLSADVGVAALVGTRIFPSMAQQGSAHPFIVYHMISQTRFPAMGADAGVIERRAQVDSYADSQTGAIALAAAVTAAMNRAGGTYASVVVQQIFEDGLEDFGQDPETRLFRRAGDYLIYYEG